MGEASDLLTPREAAAYVRRSPRTLARERSLGIGPSYVKLGAKVFYRRTHLDAWVDQHVVEPVRSRGIR